MFKQRRVVACVGLLLAFSIWAEMFVAMGDYAQEMIWPMPGWETANPAVMGMDETFLIQARDYALAGGGSGYITRGGRLVMWWGSGRQMYDLKSTTKSIGVTALGLAIQDGHMSLTDPVSQHHGGFLTQNLESGDAGWLNEMTLQHLATQTGGYFRAGEGNGLYFQPGTQWYYSDGGPNWLAEAITLTYGEDLRSVMFGRVFVPLGISTSHLTWRDHTYRSDSIDGIKNREFGSGISASVDAMARIGYLYLRHGYWVDQQIIPTSFVDMVATSVPNVVGLPEYEPDIAYNAADHYGLLWWNNADGAMPNVPMDAYWSWGLNESLIVVIPSLDIVVARAGGGWQSDWQPNYAVIEPFFEAIVQSVHSG